MNGNEAFRVNGVTLAASSSLTFFWVLNILKESFSPVKGFLNFYPPVGPLLGLFVFSIAVFAVAFLIFRKVRVEDQKLSFWVLMVSATVFSLMVFPPVFEVVVEFLHILS